MTEIIVAVISLFSVTTSVIMSFLISRTQSKTQVERARMELEETYTGKLFEKRMDVYPSLYNILSYFSKLINKDQITLEVIERTVKQLEDWDSQYAIFTSPLTAQKLFELRKIFDKYLNKKITISQKTLKKDFLSSLMGLENALKMELGVFSAKSHHKPLDAPRTIGEEIKKMQQEESNTVS